MLMRLPFFEYGFIQCLELGYQKQPFLIKTLILLKHIFLIIN